MITITKGNAILQLPCGCNSRKFKIADSDEDWQQYDADMEEVADFIDNHDKICWSKGEKK
jgi:hypothetical protein